MFNNIKMGTKLIGSFLIIVAILIAVAMVGYVNIKSIANEATLCTNKIQRPSRKWVLSTPAGKNASRSLPLY